VFLSKDTQYAEVFSTLLALHFSSTAETPCLVPSNYISTLVILKSSVSKTQLILV
jgi:hypothetical protein